MNEALKPDAVRDAAPAIVEGAAVARAPPRHQDRARRRVGGRGRLRLAEV